MPVSYIGRCKRHEKRPIALCERWGAIPDIIQPATPDQFLRWERRQEFLTGTLALATLFSTDPAMLMMTGVPLTFRRAGVARVDTCLQLASDQVYVRRCLPE
jgi:hypothetical protein